VHKKTSGYFTKMRLQTDLFLYFVQISPDDLILQIWIPVTHFMNDIKYLLIEPVISHDFQLNSNQLFIQKHYLIHHRTLWAYCCIVVHNL